MTEQQDFLALKWGTLKAWDIHSESCFDLLRQYIKLGCNTSAILQRDTPKQVKLLCQLIDACNAPSIYLEWDGMEVSKEAAKKYVREYHRELP